jgi:amidohydrolase
MRDVETLKQHVIGEVENRRAELIEIAATIHANPEIAFEERASAALLTDVLEQQGFAVERGVAGLETAFVATAKGSADTPTIAFLAEYDALPELGHACGHNLIASAALGAGLAAKPLLTELPGTIQVIGTPAEEGGGGKVIMVEQGVFDNVDVAMMVHPSSRNLTRRTSLTSHKAGIEFFGKAAHAAASPDFGINALNALIITFNSIDAMRQHLRDDARIHGIITHGGEATNIVPEYAAAQFGIRAADVQYAEELIEKVHDCAKAGARASGARLEFTRKDSYYANMMPNPILADLVDGNMKQLGMDVSLPLPNERMGSSDMGNVSQVVPGLHPYFIIAPEDVAGHTVEFREAAASDAGWEGMLQAAKFLAMTAVELLAVPSHMVSVKQAFEQQKATTQG